MGKVKKIQYKNGNLMGFVGMIFSLIFPTKSVSFKQFKKPCFSLSPSSCRSLWELTFRLSLEYSYCLSLYEGHYRVFMIMLCDSTDLRFIGEVLTMAITYFSACYSRFRLKLVLSLSLIKVTFLHPIFGIILNYI
jgi:hypothetical protein